MALRRDELEKEKAAREKCDKDLEIVRRHLDERKDLENYATSLLNANHRLQEELDEAKEMLSESIASKTPHAQSSFDGISHIEAEECTNLLAELEKSGAGNSDFDTAESVSAPSTPIKKSVSGREARMQDPMYFHFHMLLQGIKVRMAMSEGSRQGFSIEYLNCVTTEFLYDALMSAQPAVPFFDWEEWIKDHVTREYVSQVYERDVERQIERGPMSETAKKAKILLTKGMITEKEYQKIVNADKDFRIAELVSI